MPVLQAQHQQGFLKHIYIHLSNEDGSWSDPVDFNSSESDFIPVVRRKAYLSGNPKLDDKDPTGFVQIERWQGNAHFVDWCQHANPRPFVQLGVLKEMARRIKHYAAMQSQNSNQSIYRSFHMTL